MVQIKWTFQAKDDLRSIANFMSRDSKNYAKLQVLKIRNRTNILRSQIRIGKIVPEINMENIQELIEGNYRIIYRIVSENQIDILTIHHSSRDLSKREIE